MVGGVASNWRPPPAQRIRSTPMLFVALIIAPGTTNMMGIHIALTLIITPGTTNMFDVHIICHISNCPWHGRYDGYPYCLHFSNCPGTANILDVHNACHIINCLRYSKDDGCPYCFHIRSCSRHNFYMKILTLHNSTWLRPFSILVPE